MLIFIEASEYLNAMDANRVYKYIRQVIGLYQYFSFLLHPIYPPLLIPAACSACLSVSFIFALDLIRFNVMLSLLC